MRQGGTTMTQVYDTMPPSATFPYYIWQKISYDLTYCNIVYYLINNNDRLTAFDPGQPG